MQNIPHKGAEKERASCAEMAGARAKIYDLLLGIFSHLPDQQLLRKIRGDHLKNVLNALSQLNSTRCGSGLNLIDSYQSSIKFRPDEEVLTELSVDRTKILRGTGHTDLKPPYEGLYKAGRDVGQSLLEVKRFYRESGMLPDETVHEPPDYICVELDFMKRICLKEQDLWSSEGDVLKVIATEETFLTEHLGSWVGEFCQQVERHALTDFYRGFAVIMEAVVLTEVQYMRRLFQTLKGIS
ncbi:MAG: molecular chaperone TorD family protein [Desulfobacterales bacterium]|nr:molecular chaperone TorD family protein [Desulfobacterales bacterium]